MGYFHALKLAFLSSLLRKHMLWEGFYHDFSTKKVSASGGFAPCPHQRAPPPGPPPGGAAPWTPVVTSPPLTIYPGAAPVYTDNRSLFLLNSTYIWQEIIQKWFLFWSVSSSNKSYSSIKWYILPSLTCQTHNALKVTQQLLQKLQATFLELANQIFT